MNSISKSAIIESLQPAHGKAARGDPHEAYLAIERFLKASRKPVLMEPGDDPLPIASDTFALTRRGASVTIECWSVTRNLSRRVSGVKLERPGRLELEVEHFGGRTGALTLVDLDRTSNRDARRRGARLKYRERFRQSLHRQFPDWRVAELSTEADLHHSLSPSYPRALLRKGALAFAAIGAAEDSLSPDGVLSFGLIWLDYLRRRETRFIVEGLAIFLPAGLEHNTCHRVRHLDPQAARYSVFADDPHGYEERVDPRDYTNLETRLDPYRQPLDGARPKHVGDIEALLESRIRADIEAIDATLRTTPVYGQVPQFAGGHRSVIDLLAVDGDGRLTVIEIKADQDIHLPLQALDYWMRVKWHLDRSDFTTRGYFPGIPLRSEAPRLLLVAPALEYHPSNEAVLKYFSTEIPVERLGVGVEWRRDLKVMFRSPVKSWPLLSSGR
jgi:hypothetical protein